MFWDTSIDHRSPTAVTIKVEDRIRPLAAAEELGSFSTGYAAENVNESPTPADTMHDLGWPGE